MGAEKLSDLINSLTREVQEAVQQFVRFLKRRETHPPSFLAAVEEFIEQHPELLRRLAQ